jgi:hypothetical protein
MSRWRENFFRGLEIGLPSTQPVGKLASTGVKPMAAKSLATQKRMHYRSFSLFRDTAGGALDAHCR